MCWSPLGSPDGIGEYLSGVRHEQRCVRDIVSKVEQEEHNDDNNASWLRPGVVVDGGASGPHLKVKGVSIAVSFTNCE